MAGWASCSATESFCRSAGALERLNQADELCLETFSSFCLDSFHRQIAIVGLGLSPFLALFEVDVFFSFKWNSYCLEDWLTRPDMFQESKNNFLLRFNIWPCGNGGEKVMFRKDIWFIFWQIPNLMPMLLRDGELFWNPTAGQPSWLNDSHPEVDRPWTWFFLFIIYKGSGASTFFG